MWSNKTKNSAQTPSLRTKIQTNFERGRLLTPDGHQILVGSGENLVLIWQAAGTLWNNITQKVVGSWSNKTKTPIV